MIDPIYSPCFKGTELNFNPCFKDLYHVERSFIDPEEAKKLGLLYKQFLEETNKGNDTQVEKCRASSEFFPFWQILVDKNKEIGDILGEKVLPSYTYARMYLNGGELVPHIDKECCELDISIHLGGDKPWPIWIETPSGVVSALLEPGDAVMYLGTELTHWREPYDGEWYANAFFFYVFSNGPNRDQLFNVSKL